MELSKPSYFGATLCATEVPPSPPTQQPPGVPLHVIKEFGRWKSEAYMVYITLSVDVLDSHVRKAQAQALVLEERK